MIRRLSNDINRALIKPFKGLPDVAEFYTEKIGIHEYAAIYGIEKIIREVHYTKLGISKPNEYLERQMVRLTKYAAEGNLDKATFLARKLLRKSVTFRVLALNRVCPEWFEWKASKLRRVWRKLHYILSTESTDLRFNRVWIDKKPGDYARPIGAPHLEWRVKAYMETEIFERLLKAQGVLSTWQHGGRSGKGVLSCWQELIPKIKTAKYIYEFDLKGFFTNVSHKVIIEKLEEHLGEYFVKKIGEQLGQQKAEKYELPPEEKDKALLKFKGFTGKPLDPKDEPYESTLTNPPVKTKGELLDLSARTRAWYGLKAFDPNSRLGKINSNLGISLERQLELDILTLQEIGSSSIEDFEEYDRLYRENKEALKKALEPITLDAERYKELMGDSEMRPTRAIYLEPGIIPATQTEREEGRDHWAGLITKGKGMPQGLSWSPLISTVCVDLANKNMPEGSLIMYVDDGLIFANTLPELEKLKEQFRNNIESVGVNLAPEKSGVIKATGEWLKDHPKFLGLEYLPKEDNIRSQTRSGTSLKFPASPDWQNLKEILERNPGVSISGVRQKFDRLLNTKAYEAGLAHGFLGCLIAEACYKNAPPLDERKAEIDMGKRVAWARIRNSLGFIWKFQDLHPVLETLTNTSSLACMKFLSDPMIRELGMHSSRTTKRRRMELGLLRTSQTGRVGASAATPIINAEPKQKDKWMQNLYKLGIRFNDRGPYLIPKTEERAKQEENGQTKPETKGKGQGS